MIRNSEICECEGRRMADILTGSVLVADDELFSQTIVVRMVKEISANEVERSSDGLQALKVLETDISQKISLLILDINMPKYNGLQVLKAIRTNDVKCDRGLAVIMLTGNTDKELVGAALALDVDAFLAKPVSKAALESRIKAISKEERPLKTVEEYAAVDIDAALKFKADDKEDKPVTGKIIRSNDDDKKGRKYPREEVPVGSTVTEVVYTSNGQVLIGEGFVINERLKRKLAELASIGEDIPFIWAEKLNS